MVLVLSLLKSGLAVAGGIMTLIPLMASQVIVKPAMLSLGVGMLYSARGLGAAVGPLLVKKLFGETTTVLNWSIAAAFFLKALSYLFWGSRLITENFVVQTRSVSYTHLTLPTNREV